MHKTLEALPFLQDLVQWKNVNNSTELGPLPKCPQIGSNCGVIDVYPARAGVGFDLVVLLRGGCFGIQNATTRQLRQALSKLEGFDK